jgi:site-specific DNA-methyltransferase (adenine-specific)
MPRYEDAIRVFNMDGSKEFTDVWNFPSVRPYKSKHPAEKPITLLRHAIEATTHVGDIVLDCFAGTCSTALAAFSLNRRAIGIEIEEKWIEQSLGRFEACFSSQTPQELAVKLQSGKDLDQRELVFGEK